MCASASSSTCWRRRRRRRPHCIIIKTSIFVVVEGGSSCLKKSQGVICVVANDNVKSFSPDAELVEKHNRGICESLFVQKALLKGAQ